MERMKISLKDVGGAIKDVDIDPAATVGDAKKAAHVAFGRGVNKIIHRGKVMDDDNVTLGSAGAREGATLIVMLEKVKKQAKPLVMKTAPAAPVPRTAPSAPSDADSQRDATARLLALGISSSEDEARRALEMAGGDINRAAGLITEGLVSAAGLASPAAAAAHGGRETSEAESAAMTSLRQITELPQLQAMVGSDPQLLRPLLHQLGHARPEALAEIAANPGAFVRLLSGVVPPADMARHAPNSTGLQQQQAQPAGQRPPPIQLSPADEAALAQLAAIAPQASKSELLEAFVANGRNLEHAASFLLSGAN